MNRRAIFSAAIAALLATGGNVSADNDEQKLERCYGVAKAGMNDCSSNGHACAAQSTKDGDAGDWINVSKGTCKKLVNGSTSKDKK